MSEPGAGGCCFEVFTLFPAAIEGFVGAGLLGKAIEQGRVQVRCTDFRDFTHDRHRTVDDTPFGGGAGMVLKPGPVVEAIEHVERLRGPMHRILLTPSAPRFDQRVAARLATLRRIGLLCGRYEGIDDRVREGWVDECLSLGDFVLGGGEVAALTIIEAVSRLMEGVVGNPESVHTDSFGRTGDADLLEHPQYTRPAEFRGRAVPPVLLGGDHAAIVRWRHEAALRRTWALRPELRPCRRLPPEHPVHLAVPPSAIDEAAELGEIARRFAVASVVVIGAPPEAVEPWIAATAGRVQIATLPDGRALKRRLRRSEAEPRFVVVRSPSAATEADRIAVDRAAALLDLLVSEGPLGPLVLWLGAEPLAGLPIHAIYAPNPANPPIPDDLTSSSPPGPRQGLANGDAIVDISRPRSRTAALAHAALTELRDRG